MAEPSRDPKTPKTDAEKKQPETVLLGGRRAARHRRRRRGRHPEAEPQADPSQRRRSRTSSQGG